MTMDSTVTIAIIGAIQAIVVGVIAGLFARDSAKKKKVMDDAEVRAALRAEESRMSMKMMSANTRLTMATARAVKDGKSNGKMETALVDAEKTELEYFNFINGVAAKQIVT